jgi:hypothetical protein
MKDQVQQKIDQILSLAKSSVSGISQHAMTSMQTNDSLAKLIKTQAQADLFMAELDAVFKLAQSR